jgi:Protein of unknown function (DUF3131)./Uncharacterized protein conserved in bacteria (DUF2329).
VLSPIFSASAVKDDDWTALPTGASEHRGRNKLDKRPEAQMRISILLLCILAMISSHAADAADLDGVVLPAMARATWASLDALVEPSSGLPHDTLNRIWLDLFPQFAALRSQPSVTAPSPAILNVAPCASAECRQRGAYGLRFVYSMPAPGTFGSYNIQSVHRIDNVETYDSFDVSAARYLEMSGRGAVGGERFEVVLWSDCTAGFPGRPDSGLIEVTTEWQRIRLDLLDYASRADLRSLCRVSIGFNDAIHPGGTLYLDDIAFVREDGTRIHIAHDEETSVTNIGLYLASVVAARDLGILTDTEMASRLETTVTSIESLQKFHGFPQTHNRTVTLGPDEADRCISTADSGYLAAGLMVVQHAVPQFAARAEQLLNAMEWDWTYDGDAGLPYLCRFPDGSATATSHYDFYAADSRFAHAVGIGGGQIPPESWSRLKRALEPASCSSTPLFEPGWDGGGLFMILLPWIFLDEWTTPLAGGARAFIDDQICYAQSVNAPAWGFSATVPPEGNDYCGYGCTRTDFVVPHASLLAAELVSADVLLGNLEGLTAMGARPLVNDGVTTSDFGFVASASLVNGQIAPVYLLLDQAMVLLATANRLQHGAVRQYVCGDSRAAGLRTALPEYAGSCRPNGDVNGDGNVGAADVFYLINTLFVNGPSPIGSGDVNRDSKVNVVDIFYLINYLFASGPAPQ